MYLVTTIHNHIVNLCTRIYPYTFQRVTVHSYGVLEMTDSATTGFVYRVQ